MKTTTSTCKIPLSGEHAYTKGLIASHRKLVSQFLSKLGVEAESKRIVMRLWKQKITNHNIIWVYQHSMQTFLEYLCTNRFEDLKNTSEATFVRVNKQS